MTEFTFTVYRETVGHFDSKERLGEVRVLRHGVRHLQVPLIIKEVSTLSFRKKKGGT
jgi:hypothetical protein